MLTNSTATFHEHWKATLFPHIFFRGNSEPVTGCWVSATWRIAHLWLGLWLLPRASQQRVPPWWYPKIAYNKSKAKSTGKSKKSHHKWDTGNPVLLEITPSQEINKCVFKKCLIFEFWLCAEFCAMCFLVTVSFYLHENLITCLYRELNCPCTHATMLGFRVRPAGSRAHTP